MSRLAVTISRKRPLVDSAVENSPTTHETHKKQKITQEHVATVYGNTSDKENDSTQSGNGSGRARLRRAEKEFEGTAISPSHGAAICQDGYKSDGEENRKRTAAHTLSAEADRKVEKIKSSARQRAARSSEAKVPLYLLRKKYDTKPPPWQPRLSSIIVYETNRLLHDNPETTFYNDTAALENKFGHLAPGWAQSRMSILQCGNHVNARERSGAQSQPASQYQAASTSCTQNSAVNPAKTKTIPTRTIVNGRVMTTATKPASILQKSITGFPASSERFPEDLTLTELCMRYPNHLFGENLHPFLQYEWSPTRIFNLLPSQDGAALDRKVTAPGIASRLRKAKATLERMGRYDALMKGPRTHAEH